MIIWLASYPKSGSTWVRSIISSLIYSENGVFNFNLLKNIKQFPEKIYFKDNIKDFSSFDNIKNNWIQAQDKINLDNQIKFFKTHHGNFNVGNKSFTNKNNTKGVIYIVRDPRNIVKSISNHYTLSIKDSLDFMLSPKIIGNTKSFEENREGILTLLGKWNEHYKSWTKYKNNLLLIKYENLVLNPMLELNRIVDYLKKFINFEIGEKKKINTINSTSFDNLKKMENENLFKEGVLNKKDNSKVNFFNLGPENKWNKAKDEEIINTIEREFSSEMKELGYFD